MQTVATTTTGIVDHPVISQSEWIEASRKLLAKEKELTRMRDQLSKERRDLPWVKVEKEYVFEGPDGKRSLADLFDGRSQLIVYHFMFGPGWEEGCPGCSFVSDHVDAARQHFEHHDITYVAVSRAPLAELLPYKKRMGWTFPWVSSADTDFNYDFGASFRPEDLEKGPVLYNFTVQKLTGREQPGLSVFIKDDQGSVYHTYSSYERGLDLLCGAYNFIDLTPLGRNEQGPMDWVQRHDKYEG
jgi:predicted dithiol-disulfide oxidoreductase (DUF899 family)